MTTEKKMGRPRHEVTPDLEQAVEDTVLIDRFLDIPEFMSYTPETYTREQMITALVTFLLTGSNVKAARLSGATLSTVKNWRLYSKWWEPCAKVARQILSDKFEDRFTALLDQALAQMTKRITDGDVIVRDGERVNVPVRAAELNRIIGVLFDKRQLLRGDATSRTETTRKTDLDTLKQAAEDVVKEAEQRSEGNF